MPANIINSFADKSGKSKEEIERLWNKAKEQASKEGHEEDYAYIVGILKRMLGLNESFRSYISEDSLYEEFVKYANLYQVVNENIPSNMMTESVIKIPEKLKSLWNIIKAMAIELKTSFDMLLTVFKERVIFNIFKAVKFSIKRLNDIVKKGFKAYHELTKEFADYIVKHIDKNEKKEVVIKKLQDWLENHPIAKKITGVVLAGLMVYIWTSVITFTGDIDFDYDQKMLLKALSGDYSLCDIFCGESGNEYIFYVFTGATTGISFPYPATSSILFAISIVYTVVKYKYPEMKNAFKEYFKRRDFESPEFALA